MNSVAFAERSKVARHESVHASASIFFGAVPEEVRIFPLAVDQSGYIHGHCQGPPTKPALNAVVIACGILDGHGIVGEGEGDVYNLEQLVPDADERERVMDIAAQVMEHRQFKAVRDALRTRLQFKDVMYADEIERIAASVLLDATSFRVGESRAEAATSVGVRSAHAAKVADAARGDP